jgi:hypothetical protein
VELPGIEPAALAGFKALPDDFGRVHELMELVKARHEYH